MIAVRLDPRDEERLGRLAAEHGETVEQTVRRFLLDRLYEEGWSDVTDEEWAKSCESMAAEILPNEDWSDVAPGRPSDGPR
jgi:hypothetical protein